MEEKKLEWQKELEEEYLKEEKLKEKYGKEYKDPDTREFEMMIEFIRSNPQDEFSKNNILELYEVLMRTNKEKIENYKSKKNGTIEFMRDMKILNEIRWLFHMNNTLDKFPYNLSSLLLQNYKDTWNEDFIIDEKILQNKEKSDDVLNNQMVISRVKDESKKINKIRIKDIYEKLKKNDREVTPEEKEKFKKCKSSVSKYIRKDFLKTLEKYDSVQWKEVLGEKIPMEMLFRKTKTEDSHTLIKRKILNIYLNIERYKYKDLSFTIYPQHISDFEEVKSFSVMARRKK